VTAWPKAFRGGARCSAWFDGRNATRSGLSRSALPECTPAGRSAAAPRWCRDSQAQTEAEETSSTENTCGRRAPTTIEANSRCRSHAFWPAPRHLPPPPLEVGGRGPPVGASLRCPGQPGLLANTAWSVPAINLFSLSYRQAGERFEAHRRRPRRGDGSALQAAYIQRWLPGPRRFAAAPGAARGSTAATLREAYFPGVPFRSAHPPVGARLRHGGAATRNPKPKQRKRPPPRTHAVVGHRRQSKQTRAADATPVGRGRDTARPRLSKPSDGDLRSRRASAAPASRACSQILPGPYQQSIFFPSAIVMPANEEGSI
jgi:hypothetical protein